MMIIQLVSPINLIKTRNKMAIIRQQIYPTRNMIIPFRRKTTICTQELKNLPCIYSKQLKVGSFNILFQFEANTTNNMYIIIRINNTYKLWFRSWTDNSPIYVIQPATDSSNRNVDQFSKRGKAIQPQHSLQVSVIIAGVYSKNREKIYVSNLARIFSHHIGKQRWSSMFNSWKNNCNSWFKIARKRSNR